MNQLIAMLRGRTAAARATQIPITVIRIKSGLYSRSVSVKSESPRYIKIKFSESCESRLKVNFVVSWVRRDILW